LALVTDPLPIALDALYLALRLSLPVLGAAFVVALALAFLQLLTQLREPALNAIPRLLGVALVLSLSAGVWASELSGFAARLYRALPELVR
jgi:flagellar biosynthetic protein FliQ